MRIAAYTYKNRAEVGIVSDDGSSLTPFDLAVEQAAQGLLVLLETGPQLLPLREPDRPADLREVVLKAPIPQPRRNIFCVGRNYFEHVQEFAQSGYDASADGQIPEAPIIFSKLPDCVIASGKPIRHDPSVTQHLDYEAELAVVIGRRGRAIAPVDALEHVWGYTIVNDVTARDLQKRHRQWLLGKSQDTFCPMGPFAVTRDALDLANTPVRCWVNGELRQDANTAQMMFDVPALVAAISAGITLLPGDVIATGTPAGVGVGFDPPRFLKAGDVVRIEIPPIGVLENTVVKAA